MQGRPAPQGAARSIQPDTRAVQLCVGLPLPETQQLELDSHHPPRPSSLPHAPNAGIGEVPVRTGSGPGPKPPSLQGRAVGEPGKAKLEHKQASNQLVCK